MRLHVAFLGALSLGSFLAVHGCGGSSDNSGFNDDGGTTGDSTSGDGSGGDVLTFGSDGSDAYNPVYGCSGDLQSVVDMNGVVVQMCPPDQGCAAGKCVAACLAAAANKGTIGCDYVVATPSFYPGILPPCFAVFVANNWGKAVTITVTRTGQMYDVTQFGRIAVGGQPATSWAPVPSTGLPPGQVAVLFMSSDPNSKNGINPLTCPITPAVNAGTAVPSPDMMNATGLGDAWHIQTGVPVTAYDILPYGGANSYLPSAELLLPTTAWGTNYYGIVPLRGSAQPQWGQIVAAQDNTTVKIVPNVALPGGTGVNPAPMNMLTTYTLNAGQYVQWQESNEMSGSVISSDKPVQFNGGLGYDCYTSLTSPSGGGCDSAHQAIPPISALGFDYIAPPFATRQSDLTPESIPYRIVGVVNATTLTYDPPIPTGPATLAAGQVADFETTQAFRVKSQDANHPFYVGQIMPGCMVSSGSRPGVSPGNSQGTCLGDEEFVNILPPAQYLSKYIFFTDPTYATTNLVFVREKTKAGFADVTLDCAGTLSGWTPVGTSGMYEITNIDLVRGTVPNMGCNNGPHTAKSNGPFGLMVWGLDAFSSYAYPAGGNVATINAVVVPPTPK